MKTRYVALTALIALGLTGCTGTADETLSEPQNSAQSAPSETPAPLVAETSDEAEPVDVEAAFLEKFHEVRAAMPGESQIPDATDAQLLSAGEDACARISAGESTDEMSFIDGETKNGAGYYSDSGAIITAARQTLCPEHLAG